LIAVSGTLFDPPRYLVGVDRHNTTCPILLQASPSLFCPKLVRLLFVELIKAGQKFICQCGATVDTKS
jgi:hypothetical protein